ncbi:MarR family winged helix-turn-helix transcriptional regulator [Streptomyces cadmiisoli]|uniref:MarR family winged helix-turn-helix transcriptional regulator n=1 Tax=Streptomyces cadmiisoli TaxID=2184053 RepID=UPI00366A1544
MTSKRAGGPADSSTGAPQLEEEFGFAIGVIFRAYAKAVEATVADLPGGPRGYFILAAAVRGQAGSQRAIADRLGIDRTVMTYLLDDLEEAGLVERKPDPADRRSRHIVATERGAELWDELHSQVDRIDRQLLSVLPEKSQTAFRDMLTVMARDVDAIERTLLGDRAGEPSGPDKPVRPSRRRARPNV